MNTSLVSSLGRRMRWASADHAPLYEPDSHGGGWTVSTTEMGISSMPRSIAIIAVRTPEGEQYVVDTRSESTMVFDSGSCVQQLSKSAKSTTGDSSLEELMEAATEEPMECGEAGPARCTRFPNANRR